MSDLQALKLRADGAKQNIRDAEEYLERVKASAKKVLAEVQMQCPHPHQHVKFYPDPSGNNDSSEECKICGKEAKRL
jgi:hypothetical protein